MRNFFCAIACVALLWTPAKGDAPTSQPTTEPAVPAVAFRDIVLRTSVPLENGQSLKWLKSELMRISALPSQVEKSIVLEPDLGTDNSLQITVKLDGQPARTAEDIADRLVAALPDAIVGVEEMERNDEVKQTANRAAELQNKVDDANGRLIDLADRLNRKIGLADASPESLRTLAQKLNEEHEQCAIDGAAQSARRDAIAAGMGQLTDQLQKQVTDDAIAKELQTIVDLKESKAKLVESQAKSGAATETDVTAAQADAADARAKLLERRETVEHTAGGDLLGDLQRQLLSLQVDQAESQARLKEISELSADLNSARDIAGQIESLTSKKELLISELAKLTDRIEQMRNFDTPIPVIHVQRASNMPEAEAH